MKIGYFEEAEGVKSSMRLMCFIALITGILLSFFIIWQKQLDVNSITLITIWVVAAFAPKAVQKYAEK